MPLAVAVTGGARGIGLAIARAFAARGDRVVVGDLDPPADGIALDVRDRASFAAFLDRAGPVDVLVNNAGIAPKDNFAVADPAALDCVLDVNLRGVLYGTQLALPGMIERGSGHIVNIASLAGRIALPGAAAYTATKHGVIGLTEAVRAEVRGTGVRLTAVCPTFAPTEIVSGLPLRGVPTVPVERVAAAVVRAVERGGPPLVTVPRWLGGVWRIAAFIPYRLRDALGDRGGRPGDIDAAARAPYEQRIAEQYKSDK